MLQRKVKHAGAELSWRVFQESFQRRSTLSDRLTIALRTSQRFTKLTARKAINAPPLNPEEILQTSGR
jgi:hypothetical protein